MEARFAAGREAAIGETWQSECAINLILSRVR